MPPKAAKPKPKGKAAAGLNPEEAAKLDDAMSQVNAKELWAATDALQKAKALRNFFQIERDKINAYWEISRRELDTLKSEARHKDREKAEMYERHQIEIKVYKQKTRHVLYEHQVQLAQLKLEAEQSLRGKETEHTEKEAELEKDIRSLQLSAREQCVNLQTALHTRRLKREKDISEQANDYERQAKEMHLKYEKKIRTLRDDMDRQRNDEISAIERRKEDHVAELRAVHDRAFQDIKEYFTEITSSNLETIRTLKDEVASRQRTEAHNEKAMFEIAQTNKRLTEPLTKAQKQKKQLEAELANYERDRAALKTTKQELRQLEQRLKTLSWEHEVLGQRYGKLAEDRDIIYAKYNDMLQEIQQKAIFKRVLVHRKLEVVGDQLERKEAQLSDILAKANVEPSALGDGVVAQVDNLLGKKDETIAELTRLLAELTNRHERVVGAYTVYAKQNGVKVIEPTAAK